MQREAALRLLPSLHRRPSSVRHQILQPLGLPRQAMPFAVPPSGNPLPRACAPVARRRSSGANVDRNTIGAPRVEAGGGQCHLNPLAICLSEFQRRLVSFRRLLAGGFAGYVSIGLLPGFGLRSLPGLSLGRRFLLSRGGCLLPGVGFSSSARTLGRAEARPYWLADLRSSAICKR